TDGSQVLIKKMAARLMDPKEKYNFKLLTTTPIRKITIDPTKLRPVTLQWDPSPASKKLNPSPMFDYVILATPPSVWGDITITPEHPKDTMGPIQMGPAVK